MAINAEHWAVCVLNALPGLRPDDVIRLTTSFGCAAAAVEAGPLSWDHVVGSSVEQRVRWKVEWDGARRVGDHDIQVVSKRNDLSIIVFQDEGYPDRLREVMTPPPIIYVRSDSDSATLFSAQSLAIVGSRRISLYGERIVRRFIPRFVERGVPTVSGLARGVDTAVHKATLAAKGRTVAVLGCGLLQTYPPENRGLADKVAEEGALISEFPLSTRPFPGNFPRRNRIISGLSSAVLIVEGTKKSGSLITARCAADQGRPVLAVPGSIFSEGSDAAHLLIGEGARLAATAEDVFDEMGLSSTPESQPSEPQNLPADASRCYKTLQSSDHSREDLVAITGIAPERLSAILLDLELGGWIRTLPGGLVAAMR